MSGIVKGAGKVFKKVGKVLKPLIKPALIAAGVLFGGYALAASGVLGGATQAAVGAGTAAAGGAATQAAQAGALGAIGKGTLGGATAAGVNLIPPAQAAATAGSTAAGTAAAGGLGAGIAASAQGPGFLSAMHAARQAATPQITAATGAGALASAAPAAVGGAGPLGAAAGQIQTAAQRAAMAGVQQAANVPYPTPTTHPEIFGAGGLPDVTGPTPPTSIFGKIEDWMEAHPNLVKYGGGALAATAKGIGTAHLAKELQDEYWRNRRKELYARYPKLSGNVPGYDSSGNRVSASGGRSTPTVAQASQMSLAEAGLQDAPSMPMGQGNIPIPGLERRMKLAGDRAYTMNPFASAIPIQPYGIPYFS